MRLYVHNWVNILDWFGMHMFNDDTLPNWVNILDWFGMHMFNDDTLPNWVNILDWFGMHMFNDDTLPNWVNILDWFGMHMFNDHTLPNWVNILDWFGMHMFNDDTLPNWVNILDWFGMHMFNDDTFPTEHISRPIYTCVIFLYALNYETGGKSISILEYAGLQIRTVEVARPPAMICDVDISSIHIYLNVSPSISILTLQWRHNENDDISNHQPHDCLLNRLFRRKSKKTPKLRVTGLCAGNSPVTDEFPVQRASYAENVYIWWRHHEIMVLSVSHSMALANHANRRSIYWIRTQIWMRVEIPNSEFSNS